MGVTGDRKRNTGQLVITPAARESLTTDEFPTAPTAIFAQIGAT
jgi:hypothetical protein